MGAILRGVFGYCFLVLIVRTAGRRPGKQITPYEFVFIFFIGGVTLTPMVANDRSVTNGVCTIAAIAMTHFVFAWLKQRSALFGRIMDGTPLMLLKDGRWQADTLRRMNLADDDVMAMARDQGLHRLDQIQYAILERNGEISIVPKD
jgi:uncharacterized membrane protein YcaP (DUF421 family)